MGQPNLQITPDRTACARYGLNVGDVGAIVQAAIGGQAVTQVLDGDRRFDLVVRWKPEYRESLDAVRQIRVNLPSRRPDSARPGRQDRDRRGRVIHLSRGAAALRAGPIFGPRSRFAEHHRRGQAANREGSPSSGGRASGMVGRVRRTAGRQSPLRDRRAVRAVADRGRPLRRDSIAHRHLHHHGADSGRVSGRSSRADHHRHAVQRVGRRRLHFDFRHRGDGRHPAELLHPPALGAGQSVRRIDHHRIRPPSCAPR